MAEGLETQSSTSSSNQYSSQDSINKKTHTVTVPTFGGLKSQNGNVPLFPIMYPALVPGLFPPQQDQKQMNRGPGLYAVPVLPFMQHSAGFSSNTLIPFTYNIPTEPSLPETREVGGEQGQAGEQQQAVPQRQVVVRRFQIAIHLDLMLILKLAAVIFSFNQDGSRCHMLVRLYLVFKIGEFALCRWVMQIPNWSSCTSDSVAFTRNAEGSCASPTTQSH